MSLSTNDLNEIRNIVESALTKQSVENIRPLQDEVVALRNDVKEIYDRIIALEHRLTPDKQFEKLTLEQKILKINSDLVIAAKQAGVSLPR